MKKKLMALLLTLVLGISMIGCSSKSVATVNGEGIPLEYFKTYVNWVRLGYENQGYATSSVWETELEDETTSSSSEDSKSSEKKTYWDNFKEGILESMEQSEIIYQKAKEVDVLPTDEEVKEAVDTFNESIDKTESAKEQAEKAGINDEFLKYVLTRELAASAYQDYFFDNLKADESKLKEEYEANKDSYNNVTASHILIKTTDDSGEELSSEEKAKAKEKAEEVLKKAKAGEDFTKLAKEYSDDTSNAENGGELGTFAYAEMVEEFSKAAFALEKGQISDIVETEYGYHIIKVTDKATTYEATKDNVKRTLYSPDYQEELEKLVKDAKVEEDEKQLKSVSHK